MSIVQSISFGFRQGTVLISFLCVSFLACHKQKSTTSYDFNYTGSTYAGSSLHFSSTAPTSSSFLWDFGDTSYSSASSPVHSYIKAGKYLVKLVINADTSHAIRKTISIGPDSAHMALMSAASMYHYCRTMNRLMGTTSVIDTLRLADTTMPVVLLNPTTILFGADTVYYYSSTDTTCYYYGCSPAMTMNPYEKNFFFNYLSGKVYFYYQTHESAGAYLMDRYTSP